MLARLARRKPVEPRYEIGRTIGQGGMGTVLEAVDLELRRRLALKVLRRAAPGTPGPDPAAVQRFLEEAQVAAQLVHPGIVPVHELGLDVGGDVYFSMALVEGRDLETIYALAREDREGWNRTRVLGVLQRVCETMAYAHSRGVVHRDLKPANVMVGAFGEVYVMDWGLAKVLGPRVPRAGAPIVADVATDRRETVADDPDSSIATLAGSVVGTPSYMSPEQARGEELDARSDVYAVGAMLYTLLAGRRPYAAQAGQGAVEVILAIRDGSPVRLDTLAPEAPPELVAICEKAMSRAPALRYADMEAFAADLRAYLENRVVRAHRTGAWVELRKWVQRNRALALALLGAVFVGLAGSSAYAWKENQRAETERSGRERVMRLSDGKNLRDLARAERELWPALPELESRLATWLADLDEVSPRRSQHEATRADLAALGTSEPTGDSAIRGGDLWFNAPEDAWWYEAVDELLRSLTAVEALRPGVLARQAFAASVAERTLHSAEARARWESAIADVATTPVYRGLDLEPQIGLLPLGKDPRTGLWEFWHVQSGTEPRRDPESGVWRVDGETGIVLVLVPGGTCSIGSIPMLAPEGTPQPASWTEQLRSAGSFPDWGTPWHDPGHMTNELFVEAVELDPFFVAKHETTQGQWTRLFGSNPSRIRTGPDHPVESVDWNLAVEAARRLALVLPTNAQWEYACRAGTSSPFWPGWELELLAECANLADRTYAAAQGVDHPNLVLLDVDDGLAGPAPVWLKAPNPFGLHFVHGNVWEWTSDSGRASLSLREGDGSNPAAPGDESRALRGGSFGTHPWQGRSARIFPDYNRTANDADLGVRFARPLQR